MRIVRGLGWVVAALVATIVGASSYAIGNQVKAPGNVVALGFPPEGNASGNLALMSFAARKEGDPPARVDDAERRLALQAWRNEPLAASSAALLAVAMTGRDQAETRQSLLDLAGRLTRRSAFISSELINAAAQRGDEQKIFRWLSRVMLTNPDARKVYGAAMADATARDGAVAALTPILGAEPSWADYYWRLVVARPASLINAARLRSATARAPWRQTEILPTDLRLLRQLTIAGEFDAAHELARNLGLRRSASAGENLLTNGDFANVPAMPPFDWDLAALGNLGASIDTGEKRLEISAIAGAVGSAARQLLKLQAGDYRFAWSLSAGSPPAPGAIAARIECAEADSSDGVAAPIPMTEGKGQVLVTIPDRACAWYWVSIDANIPDDSMGVDAAVSELSLRPAAREAASRR